MTEPLENPSSQAPEHPHPTIQDFTIAKPDKTLDENPDSENSDRSAQTVHAFTIETNALAVELDSVIAGDGIGTAITTARKELEHKVVGMNRRAYALSAQAKIAVDAIENDADEELEERVNDLDALTVILQAEIAKTRTDIAVLTELEKNRGQIKDLESIATKLGRKFTSLLVLLCGAILLWFWDRVTAGGSRQESTATNLLLGVGVSTIFYGVANLTQSTDKFWTIIESVNPWSRKG